MIHLISTHALREEGDANSLSQTDAVSSISTHALREEGDAFPQIPLGQPIKFLPTPSARRATDDGNSVDMYKIKFLPTPSARRATAQARMRPKWGIISTHALREEGDRRTELYHITPAKFLPTPSARRATGGGNSPFGPG